jgi:hypothetical protein
MRGLAIEERGYPVPWFVEWIDGKPDFRVIDSDKWTQAIRFGNCWLCGQPTGKFKTFVIGPMCAVNRVTSEPPCHLDCAQFAAMACPFMILPRAKRREANLPEHGKAAGFHLDRNPGATCLWTTTTYKPFRTNEGVAGVLIALGDPAAVEWYSQGARCSREPVIESIDSGLHFLWDMAKAEGIEAQVKLENCYARAMALFVTFADRRDEHG